MNKTIFLFAVLIFSANIAAFADDPEQVITLKDGSQIKGVLSGIDNGIYTVKTPIIGDVHVAASDVANISNGSGAVAPAAALPTNNDAALPVPSTATTPSMDDQVAASQKALMSNPQTMATLQQMMQDPEIMQALQDPALVQAVTSHNYQAVQSNPAVQKLLTNPNMQALLQKLQAQQQQNSSSSNTST